MSITISVNASNTYRAPTRTSNQGAEEVAGEGQSTYLEGLAGAPPPAELLDDALELDGTEAIPGPRRPQFDLRHQERARVAQRPQRGLQARWPRSLLLAAAAARRGRGGARWGDPAAAPAAEAEQAARRGEERGRGHAVAAGGLLWGFRRVRVIPASFWALTISAQFLVEYAFLSSPQTNPRIHKGAPPLAGAPRHHVPASPPRPLHHR